MDTPTNHSPLTNDKMDLKDAIKTYLAYWKWFVLGVVLSFIAASTYLYFKAYSYEVSSTILINDNSNSSNGNSEISVFEDLGLFAGPQTSLDTEIGVLKSKTLIERVVKELGLNITYYIKDDIKFKELYKDDIPITINFFMSDVDFNNLSQVFFFKATSASDFVLYDEDENILCKGTFGNKTSCDFGEFIVTPKDINAIKKNQSILIKIGSIEEVAIAYKRRINITADGPKSNLLTLSLKDGIKLKAREVIDSLISYYNQDAIAFKTEMSQDTDKFINSRIDDILVELNSFDEGVETYKVDNKLSNLDSESNLVLQSNASVENQIVELSSQIRIINYLINYLQKNKNEIIPPNIGQVNENANQNAIRYNSLLLDRKRLLKGANEENPTIINLNEQIASLRSSIEQNLQNTRSSLLFSLNQARSQENSLNSRIAAVPKKERDMADIQRQQEIFETLYLYLLQKREENSISLAVTTPYARIIDRAYGSSLPVSPSKKVVFIIALLVGLIIPFVLVYIKLIFDDKVHSLKTIENTIDAPILGIIPKSTSKHKIVSLDNKQRGASESFRLLRTNVSHLLQQESDKGQTIFITSTINNEGKTFVALNLATSFVHLNKRVLLIDADIRNPKSGITTHIKTKQNAGLAEFLNNENVQLADLIKKDEQTNLDILSSGQLPKNTLEFLSNGKFEALMAFAKSNYDYIVVDTSSVNTTADTLLLGQLADVFIYVVRANYLNQQMLEIPKKLHQSSTLKNLTVLMNYGTGYGKTQF
ncbi:MAG: GumC family protein [Winogradskyella sp.]|uniref:GumC family protein n=1 Tax=Winogradskyella sp. TaxID=1883156 RepID=UPI00385E9994